MSRAGSVYARLVLGIDVHDLTGGFKCFRRIVLETIDLDSISSLGYTFQVETTYRALRAGFRVKEVPIVFSDREVGGSKMTKMIVAEAVWRIPALRYAAMRSRFNPGYSDFMALLTEVTDATFEREVTQSDRPVVVDFWAPWCGPCRVIGPILEDMATQHGERVTFTKLNVDDNPQVAGRFNVLSIPTVILFENGEPQETVIGARSKSHRRGCLGTPAERGLTRSGGLII